MASQTQIDANRRNAAQSTGPKSINGKYIVSKNAIRHGLLSNDGLLMDEDPAEFARFQARWEQDLAPIGEIEKLLARSIISLAWRMERAPGVEAGLHLWNRYSESRESIIGWTSSNIGRKSPPLQPKHTPRRSNPPKRTKGRCCARSTVWRSAISNVVFQLMPGTSKRV